MTTTSRSTRPTSRVSFGGVFASEWLKARSLRSTWWLSASAIVATAAITAFWTVPTPAPTEKNVLDAVAAAFFVCEILLILIGTMISTADYENHAITVFIAAVPRRTPIVLAKVLLAALIGLVLAVVATLVSFGLSVALHGGGASLTDPDVLRVLVDIVVFGASVTVISAAVGLVVRSTIAAVGATFGFLYIVPIAVGLVPLDAFTLFSATFPGQAATNFFTIAVDPGHLDPVTGLVTTLIWTGVWVVVAIAAVRRRNA